MLQYNAIWCIAFYYIDTDEIPGFFHLLKNQWRYFFYLSHVGILQYVTILAVSKMNEKKLCLCWNFISIYKINRTLHGRLGIRILSPRAKSISHSFSLLIRERYFHHSKIKFVSPRGHVISSICCIALPCIGLGQRGSWFIKILKTL